MAPSLEKVIFLAASALDDEAGRRLLLDRACGGDAVLRARVDALFAIQAEATDYFETSGGGASAAPQVSEPAASGEQAGASIGPYRLIRRVGDGGCGVVYLAEQDEPVRRQVALKIIRLGMDTEEVISRFESERRALAMMEHPNIARVLDAGATASGRPFFVMEFVDGEKITDFCDSRRLGIRPRLELLEQVCLAIQHAHQKGVTHRDIKPSNVLVRMHDGAPVAKVIDFGIAKATTANAAERPALTRADQVVGTPAYLSPEMAAGGADVDTRSDVHGLGVLLHELLCGVTPFAGRFAGGRKNLDELRRVLREEDPPSPSSCLAALPAAERAEIAARRGLEPAKLVAELRGDLDRIVLKATERDRERRHESAYGLAADLRRYLAHEPVSARPPDVWYRCAKFIRRNRVSVLSGAVVACALIAGLGVSTRMFLREKHARAEQERLRAVAESARANEAALREQAEWRERIAQAAVRLSHVDFEGADDLLARVPFDQAPRSLEAAQTYSKVGEWHVLAGRWREAADRFATFALVLPQVDPSDSDTISITLLPAAAMLGLAEDEARYTIIREMAVERFGGTSRPVVAEQLLKACLLRPAPPELLKKLAPLAERLEAAVRDGHAELVNNASRIAWSGFALSLFYYRQGAHAKAEARLRSCFEQTGINPSRDAAARCLLALIDTRLGRDSEGAAEVEEARQEINARFAEGLKLGNVNSFWFDWINASVLLREASAGVETSSSAATAEKK